MRIIIKIGTSTLAHATGMLNLRKAERLVHVIADLKNAGHEIVLVSSGAIGIGAGKLHLKQRPSDVPTRQACASVGQCELMYEYDKLFGAYNHTVSQVLLTLDVVDKEERRRNAVNTLEKLLEMNVIPIINENDTVATAEIAVGDNDTLSAIVATCINADINILMSDIDGLYTADPHKDPDAKLISVVPELTEEIMALGGGSNSSQGTGGMATKLRAAQICTTHGIDMIICNGSHPSLLYDIMDGKAIGTRFIGKKENA